MAVVSLALFKKHVNADDFTADDEYLTHLLEAAEVSVVTATNRTIEELTDSNGGMFPVPLKHAIMMLAGHWYNQRESVSTVQMHEVPDGLQSLVKPYWILVNDAGGENEI